MLFEKLARTNGQTAYLNRKANKKKKNAGFGEGGRFVGGRGSCTNGAKQPEMPPCMSASISEAVYRSTPTFPPNFPSSFYSLFPTK